MMKRIGYIVIAAAALAAFSSCNDEVLDLHKSDAISDTAVWSSEENADLYLTGLYNTFREVSNVGQFETHFYDGMTDLFKDTGWYAHGNSMNIALLMETGFTSASAGLFECWSTCYSRIRSANSMILAIREKGEKFGADWQAVREAEVRFCRAYAYYLLARVYGGVPLRTETSGTQGGMSDGANEGDILLARASEKETYEFILSDLQFAAENLPEAWPSKWQGRATKLSAYAFISRMALYTENWQLVVDAADKCKELGAALAPDYAALFDATKGQDNTKEVLFSVYYLQGKLTHNYDKRMRPMGDMSTYGTECYAYFCPTEELVSLYEWKDGSEFNLDTFKDDGHADPYTDREPRFHATVLYNGADWDGRKIDVTPGGLDEFSDFELQTGCTQGYTCTGYYTRKYVQESNANFPTKYSDQPDDVIRYAEVLLNKAEAEAHLSKYAEARAALNEVRARVSLPAKTSADDLESVMKLVRRERCVELAGEGLRYWDLRRWKLAKDVINGKNCTGVKVTGTPGNYTYKKVDVDGGAKRIFLDKYYYFAIPSGETSINTLCEQNEEW